MKPFTTTRTLTDGREIFEMQVEGVARAELLVSLSGDSIRGLAIPRDQTLSEAWFAKLSLSSGRSVEISASSTSRPDWSEVGTINLRVLKCAEGEGQLLKAISIAPCRIENVLVLDVSGDGYIAEAGVVFELAEHPDLVAMAGEIPGSFFLAGLADEGKLLDQSSQSVAMRRPIAEMME